MLVFYLYLFAVTLLGSVNIGPFSLRVYATIGMIAYLLIKSKKNNFININHGYLKIYIAFLALMGVAQLINGEIFEYQFLKKLLAYHLVCVITFLAIEIFVNSEKDLRNTLFILTCIMLVNSVTTLLQYKGSSIGWVFGSFFGDIESSLDYFNTHDTLLGVSNTPGIWGNVVANAASIAIVSPLSICLIDKKNNTVVRVVSLLNVISSFFACFVTQQRTAFVLYILCILLYLIIYFRRYTPVILLSLVIMSLFGLSFELDNIEMGRLSDFSDDGREYLYDSAFEFIANHPILGGPMTFQKEAGLSAHNVLVDSWIFAGLLGFISMTILIIKTIVNGIRVFLKGLKQHHLNYYLLFCSLAVLNSMAYGFTHNTSYLTGFVLIFIVLALMLKAEKITGEI